MLQSIDFGNIERNDISMVPEEEGLVFYVGKDPFVYVQELQKGVYETNSFNFEHLLEHISGYCIPRDTLYEPLVNEKRDDEWRYVAAYGVCDTYKQILEQIPEILKRPNSYIITVTSIQREHEPPQEGWRWSKWGEYIGTHEITAEYLYDEQEIEEVFVYHVYEVQAKSAEKE